MNDFIYEKLGKKEYAEIYEVQKFLYKKLDDLNDDELFNVFSRIIDDISDNVQKYTIPEQPEIIHCKDCKYAHITVDGSCKYCDIHFPSEKKHLSGDYFCASGKREGEPDDD